MPTLITADLHLNAQARDEYRWRGMRTLRDIGKRHKVDRLIILGDLTSEKDHHGAWMVNAVVRELSGLLDEFSSILVLRGNHDYRDPDTPFFGFVDHIGVVWLNSPTIMQLDGIGRCLFLPHTNNHEQEWCDLNFPEYDVIFAHNTFAGAAVNGRALRGIPIDIFTPTAKVISGDVHVPQQCGPVTYVGAPWTEDFGDDYEPRVLILNGNMKSVVVDGPQKCLWEVDSLKQLRNIPSPRKGDIVKVRIGVRDLAKWPAIKQQVLAWGKQHGLLVHSVHPIPLRAAPSPTSVIVVTSDDETVRNFGARVGIDEVTIEIGVDLCREV